MNDSIKISITLILLQLSALSFAESILADPESTRVKSMAGTGVGSLLLNESPLFNPASVAFFAKSSLYFQGNTLKLDKEINTRVDDYKTGTEKIVTIIDTSSRFKGGFSYQYQNTELGKRARYSASMARNLGKKSSLGMIIRHTNEDSIAVKKTYNQMVIGATHVPTETFSVGFIVVDPDQKVSEYFKSVVGTQLTINDFISILVDIGSGDVHNYQDEAISNFSIQLRSFENLYLRYGKSHDKMQNLKGTGAGFSWVGPKFSFDYAVKISEVIDKNSGTIFEDEQIVENSFAVAVVF